ncbi:hypothetical protein GCM10010211_15080 [Streptomyces albospinus]|uniref:Uncharacterized protein n=1 Tax=Streptomyces albospinus TaxID=285515 RepID=A0ABQ2USF7_9ACTN|nr:hypothetical protein [Streptomyces albospinus]GGU51396.1 hypothetical protein GCM10010211_15080 [Streptomyces albospinus]
MRRVFAALLGAFALAGALSMPAHADGPGGAVLGILGAPVKATSDIGPLHIGRLPVLGS